MNDTPRYPTEAKQLRELHETAYAAAKQRKAAAVSTRGKRAARQEVERLRLWKDMLPRG